MNSSIVDFYTNKNILITGTTGFLGKVLLEKFLYAVPNCGKIYILIRHKKGSSLMERFKKEILESFCFDRLRKIHNNSNDWCLNKVIPIEGDLLKKNLGLSQIDEKILIDEINIIINSAASINFDSRLDDAIEINVNGTLRVFDLSKKVRNLSNFIHISTAYVNSDKNGWIDEQIYEYKENPLEVVAKINKIPKSELVNQTPEIIGKFPNTYTFTKNLSERILKILKEKHTITIARPSIIGSSNRDPIPGWVDTVSAGGANYFLGGLGILRFSPGNKHLKSDQVPVDYVVDTIIVSGAFYANCQDLNVFHIGTADRNPVTLGYASKTIVKYWNLNPPKKRIAKAEYEMIENPTILKIKKFKSRIPTFLYMKYADTFGNSEMKKNSFRLKKILQRADDVGEMFKFFTSNEWIFSNSKAVEMLSSMSFREKEIFQLDVKKINWDYYLFHFGWGLHTFILKEEIEPPSNNSYLNILSHEKDYNFSDINWARKNGKSFLPKNSSKIYFEKIIKSQEVINLIKDDGPEGFKKVQDMCKSMFANYNMKTFRVFAYVLHKSFKSIYDKIVVNEEMIKIIENIENNGSIIYTPNHVSHLDFLIISYILFAYKLKCPFVNSTEDFLNISVLSRILRNSGGFFTRKSQKNYGPLYTQIVSNYIKFLLEDKCNLEIFLNVSRSRSGKDFKANNEVFNIFVRTLLRNNLADGKNVYIVPISINYERVIEGETFPFELLGEEKVKESLPRLIRSLGILKMNFGRVFVEFCEPINVWKYFNENKLQANLNEEEKVISLRNTIMTTLNKASVIMPTSIIASILLMQSKGMNEEMLLHRSSYLAAELIKRKKKVGCLTSSSVAIPVRNTCKLLSNVITHKKDMFSLSFSPKVDYKNILLLAYYRNSLVSAFSNEAKGAIAIFSFGYQIAYKEGVNFLRFEEEFNFISSLLKREFPDNAEFEEISNSLINFGLIEKFSIENSNSGELRVKVKNEWMVTYLCSLLWPFIESYWLTSIYLLSLKNQQIGIEKNHLIQQIQSFAESMYEEKIIEHYDSCSQDTINKSLKTFTDWKYISKDKNKKFVLSASEEKLRDLENYLNRFLKHSYGKSFDSPIEIARKSILVDYPFMAKL